MPPETGAVTEAVARVDASAAPDFLGGSKLNVLEGLNVKGLVTLFLVSDVAGGSRSVAFSSVLADAIELLSREEMPGSDAGNWREAFGVEPQVAGVADTPAQERASKTRKRLVKQVRQRKQLMSLRRRIHLAGRT